MSRAQAAMEFLMTYGWAIMIVIATVAAMSYFGLLSFDSFLPNTFTMGGGISGGQYKMSTTDLSLSIINNFGSTITVTGLTVTPSPDSAVACTVADVTSYQFDNSQIHSYNGLCPSVYTVGDRLKATVLVEYTKAQESVTHRAEGLIKTRVES